MKRVWIALVLLAMLPARALASPDVKQYRAVLHPAVHMAGIFAEPFDRWASELAQMLTPVVEQAQWPEGESLGIDIVIRGRSAVQFELIQNGELLSLSCSLMDEGQVLLTGDEALDAMYLMDSARWALSPDTEWALADCTLNMSAEELAKRLHAMAGVFDRWAEDAPQDVQKSAQAVGAMCTAIAEIIAEQPDAAPIMSVYVHYEAPNLLPSEVNAQARAAPESLLGALLAEAPGKLARAVIESGE